MITEMQDAHIRLRLSLQPIAVPGALQSYEHLVRLARRGRKDPHALTALETSQVCRALITHYAQMGIG